MVIVSQKFGFFNSYLDDSNEILGEFFFVLNLLWTRDFEALLLVHNLTVRRICHKKKCEESNDMTGLHWMAKVYFTLENHEARDILNADETG